MKPNAFDHTPANPSSKPLFTSFPTLVVSVCSHHSVSQTQGSKSIRINSFIFRSSNRHIRVDSYTFGRTHVLVQFIYAAMISRNVEIEGEKKYSPPRGSMNLCGNFISSASALGFAPLMERWSPWSSRPVCPKIGSCPGWIDLLGGKSGSLYHPEIREISSENEGM